MRRYIPEYILPFQPRSVAMQGLPGSNSDNAIHDLFNGTASVPCATLEEAFNLLQTKAVDLAVIPAENSIAQKVPYVLGLIRDTGAKIVGEIVNQIDHCVMGLPGTEIAKARVVMSHKHALSQCGKWLAANPHLQIVQHVDTAGAAKDVSELEDHEHIAIAPRAAAETYQLKILAENIQDQPKNHTRFVVLSRELHDYPVDDRIYRTALLAKLRNPGTVAHTHAAQLTISFAQNNCPVVNMETYLGTNLRHPTIFYEVKGHKNHAGLQRVLANAKDIITDHQIIGCYPAHPNRIS